MIALTSPDFEDDGRIPTRFTCDGEGHAPALRWEGLPAGTAEVALLVEDPDAPGGTFVHWVLWGVEPTAGRLTAGVLPAGATEGRNDFGRRGWNGPCPPGGHGEHRYVFTLFALIRAHRRGAGRTGERAEGSAAQEGARRGAPHRPLQ